MIMLLSCRGVYGYNQNSNRLGCFSRTGSLSVLLLVLAAEKLKTDTSMVKQKKKKNKQRKERKGRSVFHLMLFMYVGGLVLPQN